MVMYEPAEATYERRRRMQALYPELASSDPETVLKVDAYTSQQGRLPSTLTQETVRTANRITGAQRRALGEIGATQEQVSAFQTIAQQEMQQRAPRTGIGVGEYLGRAAGALDAPVLDQFVDEGSGPLYNFAREASRPSVALSALIPGASFIRGANLGTRVLGEAVASGVTRGAQDEIAERSTGLPEPLRTGLPIAGGLAAGIAGASGVARVSGAVGDAVRAGGSSVRPRLGDLDGSVVAPVGLRGESSVLSRELAQVAEPLEQSTRGILRDVPGAPGAVERATDVPFRPRIAGASESPVADVQPFRVTGPPTYTPDEVLASARSDAARVYAESARAVDEPVYGGVVDALEQASAAVRTDPQGAASRLAGRIPGLRKIRDWDRPGLTMEKRLLEGHIARRGVESSLVTGQSPQRYGVLRELDEAFGEGAARGGRVLDDVRVNVDDLHILGGQEYPGSGTLYDWLQRPYAYAVPPEQATLIRRWAQTDEGMRQIVNERYGTEIGQFVSERGGAYVPNVNVSEARQATLDNLARNEALAITGAGKSKPRVWESGFDRWKNDLERVNRGEIKAAEVFTPETDLAVLGYTSDLTKARAAGNVTMRAGVGGKTITEVKEELAPRLVAQRDQLRKDVASISGRLQRAEQSLRRDATVARRLESQADQTARRAEEVAGQAERRFRPPRREIVDETAQAFPASDPEVDAIIARMAEQPQTLTFERMEAVVNELDRRVTALSRAAQGPRTRADLAGQGIEMLRDDLADLRMQYADVKRAYDAVDPRDWAQARSLPGRYFPSAEAAQIDELMRPAKTNALTRTLEGWRSQVLAGDVGPLTGIQGIIAAASGRAGTTRAVAGSLADAAKTGDLFRPYRQEAMERFIAENADLVQEYAFYTGRNVGGRLPAEIGQGGALAKIPGFVDANEGMFNVVTRRQIEMYRRVRDDLVKAGYDPQEAAAASADLSNKVLPLMTPARLGQSAAQAQEQRFLPTSLGFIRQPLALTEEAFTAMAKMATGQSVTPRQKLALSIYSQMIGNLMAASVATAAMNAVARDDDVRAAILNALDPGSRSFMAVSAGDMTIPLANVYRSPLRVGIGMIRNTLAPAIKEATGLDVSQGAGDSPINYATARLGPAPRAAFETLKELTSAPWERKYQGDSEVLRLLSAASIAGGAALPIPAQGIGEEAKEQYETGDFDPRGLAQVATAETAGLSLIPEEPRRTLDVRARAKFGDEFDMLSFDEQETVLAENPEIADKSYRVRREEVAKRLAGTGLDELTDRAWSEVAEGYGIDGPYDAYREATIADFTEQHREAGSRDPESEALNAFNRLPQVKKYRDYLSRLRQQWAGAHMDDGVLLEALRYDFVPSSVAVRELASVAQ